MLTAGRTWSADLSNGSFAQWSWYGQGQSNLWGHISVVSPASQGIPAPTVGSRTHVGRMEVTPEDAAAGRIHAKLYQSFSTNRRSPADVSGTYAAWYYIPTTYSMPRDKSTNLFQFKEKYNGVSDPLWWVQLAAGNWARGMGGASWVGEKPARSDQPVAFLNHWGNPWKRRLTLMTMPLGRWFEVRAVVSQGQSIEFSIDGQRFDTALASDYPVSPVKGTSSEEWIFGVGNYSDAPGTHLYLGGAGYTKR